MVIASRLGSCSNGGEALFTGPEIRFTWLWNVDRVSLASQSQGDAGAVVGGVAGSHVVEDEIFSPFWSDSDKLGKTKIRRGQEGAAVVAA